MSEQVVKRYDIDRYGARECDNGYWIHASDFDALQSLNAELLEALDNVVHAEMNSPIHENNSGCIKRMQGIARSALAKARSQA